MYPLIIAAVIIIDQLSKCLISSGMSIDENIPVISGIFDITYIRNDGAAYGMFAGRQTLLLVVTAIIIVIISAYVIIRRKSIIRLEKIALGLIVGGGLGNFISRAVSGSVVDFLNIHIIPIFNAADIAVCVGCGLLVISVLIIEPKKTAGKDSRQPESSNEQ